eukprot:3108995-Pyramimonas_sp.AAC.1
MWGDVPLDEACDPRHPSNQYIIQFKPNTVQLVETVCEQSKGNATFDFEDFRCAVYARSLRSIFSLPLCDWRLLRVYSLSPCAIGA